MHKECYTWHTSGHSLKRSTRFTRVFLKAGWWMLCVCGDYLTCVSPTHVHVADQPPGVALWLVNLNALPHKRSVVSSCSIQKTTQHTYTCRKLSLTIWGQLQWWTIWFIVPFSLCILKKNGNTSEHKSIQLKCIFPVYWVAIACVVHQGVLSVILKKCWQLLNTIPQNINQYYANIKKHDRTVFILTAEKSCKCAQKQK